MYTCHDQFKSAPFVSKVLKIFDSSQKPPKFTVLQVINQNNAFVGPVSSDLNVVHICSFLPADLTIPKTLPSFPG